MPLLPPAPICVASADGVVRRNLAEVLEGQGHRIVQAEALSVLVLVAREGISLALVDPALPGFLGDPLARLRAAPALHGRAIMLLRGPEMEALRHPSPAPAIIQLVLRIQAQVAGDAQLDLLQDISGRLTTRPDLESTQKAILEVLAQLVETDTGTLFIVDDEGRIEARAAWGYDLDMAQLRRLHPGEGVVGWVVERQQPTIVGDSDMDERFRAADGRSSRSMLGVPIAVGRRVLGAVTLVRRAPREQFSDADLVLVGTVANYAGIALETARLHEQERALRRRLDEVEEMHLQERDYLRKLEEYDRLYTSVVATVSHELKTPLMGIRGFAQMLRDGDVEGEEAHDFAREIHDNAVRLSRYVEGVLSEDAVHSGRVRLERQPLELHGLVGEALRAMEPLARDGHQLSNRVPRDLTLVDGDHDKLLQVLTNLVSNAVKYSPTGGDVVVAAEERDGMIELTVEDQGLGIPEDARDRVFERFYRVPGKATQQISGTGLGLSIVRGLVELHGGTIWVDAGAHGRGSRFHVTLPRAPKGAARPGNATSPSRSRGRVALARLAGAAAGRVAAVAQGTPSTEHDPAAEVT